jgi:hypothetical protein
VAAVADIIQIQPFGGRLEKDANAAKGSIDDIKVLIFPGARAILSPQAPLSQNKNKG